MGLIIDLVDLGGVVGIGGVVIIVDIILILVGVLRSLISLKCKVVHE
jgi:hypothetical protein